MKNKKGFTLIELLAVIVILAIIALIATPIILNMINNARSSAFLDTGYGLLDSADAFKYERDIENDNRNYTFIFGDGDQVFKFNNEADDKQIVLSGNKKLNFKGKAPDSGSITIKKNGEVSIGIWDNSLKKCAFKNFEDKEVKYDNELNTKELCYAKSSIRKATWFWANSSIDYEMQYITDKNKREAVLDHLSKIDINTIYINIENGLTIDDFINKYGEFIKYANTKNIDVYILDGDPTSIMPSKYRITINDKMDLIYEYNIRMKNQNIKSEIKGMHYDVEFYGNGNDEFENGIGKWIEGQSNEAKHGGRRLAFINFAKYAKNYANSKNIKVEYDIPQVLSKYTYFDENNQEKNMMEEIQKYADHITIMYYVTMKKYIANNYDLNEHINLLTITGNYRFDNGETININKSTLDYIKIDYSVGTDLSSFRKDYAKAKCGTDSFVNELVPWYIDTDLKNTDNLNNYLRKYYTSELNELNKYSINHNLVLEAGIGFHDVWEVLNFTGFENTQVMTNRINQFKSDFNDRLKNNCEM